MTNTTVPVQYFSPLYLSSLIVNPLRYYFGGFTSPDPVWSDDPTASTIEIDTINNFNKISIQYKPRILVSRGAYSINSIGLSDALAEGTSSRDPGDTVSTKFLLVSGQAQILIEAANEGTCERITELVETFLTRAIPLLCDTQGFKQFALPLSISPCTPNREDVEIFQCSLGVPWAKEVQFKVGEQALQLKSFLLGVTSTNGDSGYTGIGVSTSQYVTTPTSVYISPKPLISQIIGQNPSSYKGLAGGSTTHVIGANSTEFWGVLPGISHIVNTSITEFKGGVSGGTYSINVPPTEFHGISSGASHDITTETSEFVRSASSATTQVNHLPTISYRGIVGGALGQSLTTSLEEYIPPEVLINTSYFVTLAPVIGGTPILTLAGGGGNEGGGSGSGGEIIKYVSTVVGGRLWTLDGTWWLDGTGTLGGNVSYEVSEANTIITNLLTDYLTHNPTGDISGNTFTFENGSSITYSIVEVSQ